MKIHTYLLTAALSLGLTNAATAASFTYEFKTSGGNVTTATPSLTPAGAPTVTVTSWAKGKSSGNWFSGTITQNGSFGMGANNANSDNHTIDNSTAAVDYLVFKFSAPVDVTSFLMGYISGDSDYRWAVGSPAGTLTPLAFGSQAVGTNEAILDSLFASSTGVSDGSITPTLNLIPGANFETYLMIGAAYPNDTLDNFKISAVSIQTRGVPDAGSTIALLGLSLLGLFGLQRRLRS